MDATFWLEKWASGQIGFHQPGPHPLLLEHFDALGLAPVAAVFAPLCGKSHDLAWLHERGCHVHGIELSAIALHDFFHEHALQPQADLVGSVARYRAERYTLYCGDVFALDRATLGAVDAIYDRAALVALDPAQRRAYADHLTALAARSCIMLLITLDYDQAVVSPPPHVVERAEIDALYSDAWTVEHVASAAAEVKGVAAREHVYVLRRS